MTHQEELHAAKLEGWKEGFRAGWDRRAHWGTRKAGDPEWCEMELARLLPPSDGAPAREIPEPEVCVWRRAYEGFYASPCLGPGQVCTLEERCPICHRPIVIENEG